MKKKIVVILIFTFLMLVIITPILKTDSNILFILKEKNYSIINSDDLSLKSTNKKQIIDNNFNNDYDLKNFNINKINKFLIQILDFKMIYLKSYINNINSNQYIEDINLKNVFKVNNFLNDYVIQGYVIDNSTDLPINNASITIVWNGDRQSLNREITESDINGFYNVNVKFGGLWGSVYLIVRTEGYYDEIIELNDYLEDVNENGQLWFNISLINGAPFEDSYICGYVTNFDTNESVENAILDFFKVGYATYSDYINWNYTKTDNTGFFKINKAAGSYENFEIHSDNYYYNELISDSIYDDVWSNNVLWINISLIPRPEETSTIQGKITNELTRKPVKDILILLFRYTNPAMVDMDWAITDSQGNYFINIPPGYPPIILTYPDGYFEGYNFYYKNIENNEKIDIDIGIQPYPKFTSTIKGVVTDKLTDQPIKNAEVLFLWVDTNNSNSQYLNYIVNLSYTDSSGFYSIKVPPGWVSLQFECYKKYFYEIIHIFEIKKYETVTYDMSLYPYPNEESIACGYITDEETSNVIPNSRIYLHWKDNLDHSYSKETYTNKNGFYSFNIPEGKFSLQVYKPGYTSFYTNYYEILDYKTLWVNISMAPYPSFTSIVTGYVKDGSNNNPIKYAIVINRNHDLFSINVANSVGFYKINVSSGDNELTYSSYGYKDIIINYDIKEYEKLWNNGSLEKIIVKILKPEKGFYINNNKILQFLLLPISTPIIIGEINVEVNTSIDNPEIIFLINNKIKYEDFYWNEPYNWTWDEKIFGRYKLEIIVVPTDSFFTNFIGDEITVWKFL